MIDPTTKTIEPLTEEEDTKREKTEAQEDLKEENMMVKVID